MDAIPTLRINTQNAHLIELADSSNYRSWVPFCFGLAGRLQQGLNAPGQHFLPVEVRPTELPMTCEPVAGGGAGQIEITLSTGHRLTLCGAFDVNVVLRLARGLATS